MNAKRGFLPEDERNFSPEAIGTMKTASRHICYLLNEGYDLRSASTFVGNHFVLSERQRLAIARSVAADEQLKIRKAKEKTSLEGTQVWIDGFNTAITLEVMFSDSILFECMDGTVRDLAALRGTYRIIPETEKAVDSTLWDKNNVITTDSIILDHCICWFNLIKICVQKHGVKTLCVWEQTRK